MRLKMYLRGLGLGIIVTTLIVSVGKSGRAAELSDEEIKTRARALGMVEEDDLLLSQAANLAEEAAKNEVSQDTPDAAMSPVSADALSKNAQVPDNESLSENGEKSPVSAGSIKPAKNEGKSNELKSAGAESALDHSVKNSEKKDDKSEDTKEAGLDAGKAALTSSSSDKKTSSSSDKKTSSSSDKKTSSSSDKKSSSSSDKKTSSSSKASETAAETAVETPAQVEVQAPEAAQIPATETEGAGEPLPSAAASLSVTIVKGESSTAVAKKLQAAGIVADAMQFDQYLCLNGYDRHLVTGAHTIPAGASPRDIAEIITSR